MDEPVYVDFWGTYITTPTATDAKGVVQHETTIVNKTSQIKTIKVKHEYFNSAGKSVATASDEITIAAGEKGWSGVFTNILNPALWNVYQPNLYSAITTISEGEKVLDTYKTTFGIRHITYNANGVITSYSIHYTKLYENKINCYMAIFYWNVRNHCIFGSKTFIKLRGVMYFFSVFGKNKVIVFCPKNLAIF